MDNVMVLVDGSAYRPSSRVTPLSSFFVANLFIEDDKAFGFLWEDAWPPAVEAAFGVTIAVALATLPLKSLLAGAGDTLLTGVVEGVAAGLLAGLATTLAGFFSGLDAGLLTGLVTADVTAGLPRLTTTGFGTGLLTATFLMATLFGAAFPDAAFVGAAFLGAPFFGAPFFGTTFFGSTFLAATFLTTGLGPEPAFLTGTLTTFLLATGFAAGFFATALLAGLATRAGLAAALTAFFTSGTLPAAAFDLPPLASDALAAVFPLCALLAVELALVFAISLHRGWPRRPRVIADVFYTIKPASGILVPLHAASGSGKVNILTRLILWMIRLYKRWISPLLGKRCRFYPTCSDYARMAVIRFGPWRGSLLTGWRLLRCQPLCDGGEDPVPKHFHYPRCRCHGNAPDVH